MESDEMKMPLQGLLPLFKYLKASLGIIFFFGASKANQAIVTKGQTQNGPRSK